MHLATALQTNLSHMETANISVTMDIPFLFLFVGFDLV